MKVDYLTSRLKTLQTSALCRHLCHFLIPAVFALAYFLYGYSQLFEYGVTWDEPLHRNWGKIFLYFWKTGDQSVLELMPGHGVFYGPLYYALNLSVSEYLLTSGLFDFVEANHVLNLFTGSFGVFLLYTLAQMIGGKRVAFFSTVLFCFYPQLLAHVHYNPKDIPLLTGVLFFSNVFVYAILKKSRPLLLVSAFLFGVLVAVKVTVLLLAPVIACVVLYDLFSESHRITSSVVSNLYYLLFLLTLCAFGVYFFWPSAWNDPSLILRAFQFFLRSDFWPGRVRFFHTEFSGAELPWYYIPFEFFAASPVVFLVSVTLGMMVLLHSFTQKFTSVFLYILLWFSFPLLYSIKPGLVRYDGIRQFFFVLPSMCIIGGFGLDFLLKRFLKKFSFAYLTLSLALLLSLSIEVIKLHPFEGSYRNEIIQLLYPSRMDQVFEVEYWGATYRQGMNWLITHAEPNPVICVPTAGVLMEWYEPRPDFSFECSKRSTHLMFFSRYSEADRLTLFTSEPDFTIDRMGARLLSIYKI